MVSTIREVLLVSRIRAVLAVAPAAALIGALSLAAAPPVSAQCVEGTITADMQLDGPWQGFYKYVVNIEWDTPRGLSHLTLDFHFGFCAEAACTQTWLFEEPAGTGDGPEGCEFGFEGGFVCQGDPSTGFEGPVLKWDAVAAGDCEAGQTGAATLVFYTDVPPNVGEAPIGLVKNGQNVCEGEILGAYPMPCPVPTVPTTWGNIKRLMSRHS